MLRSSSKCLLSGLDVVVCRSSLVVSTIYVS